jgi:hypothetical protein
MGSDWGHGLCGGTSLVEHDGSITFWGRKPCSGTASARAAAFDRATKRGKKSLERGACLDGVGHDGQTPVFWVPAGGPSRAYFVQTTEYLLPTYLPT